MSADDYDKLDAFIRAALTRNSEWRRRAIARNNMTQVACLLLLIFTLVMLIDALDRGDQWLAGFDAAIFVTQAVVYWLAVRLRRQIEKISSDCDREFRRIQSQANEAQRAHRP